MKEITEVNEILWKPEIEVVRYGIVDIVSTSGKDLEEDELPPWIIA